MPKRPGTKRVLLPQEEWSVNQAPKRGVVNAGDASSLLSVGGDKIMEWTTSTSRIALERLGAISVGNFNSSVRSDLLLNSFVNEQKLRNFSCAISQALSDKKTNDKFFYLNEVFVEVFKQCLRDVSAFDQKTVRSLSMIVSGLEKLGYKKTDLIGDETFSESWLNVFPSVLNEVLPHASARNTIDIVSGLINIGFMSDINELFDSSAFKSRVDHLMLGANARDMAPLLNLTIVKMHFVKENLLGGDVSQLLGCIKRVLPAANIRDIDQIIYALGKLGITKEELEASQLDLLSYVLKIKNSQEENAIGMTNILVGLSEMGFTKDELRNSDSLLEYMVYFITNEVDDFTPRRCSGVLHAFAKIGLTLDELDGIMDNKSFFQMRLVPRINALISEANCDDIVSFLNQLAQILGTDNGGMDDYIANNRKFQNYGFDFKGIVLSINRNMPKASPAQMAGICRGLVRVGLIHEKKELLTSYGFDFNGVVGRLNQILHNANSKNIANTLNELAQLDFSIQDFKEAGLDFEQLFSAINQVIPQANIQELSIIINGLNQNGFA